MTKADRLPRTMVGRVQGQAALIDFLAETRGLSRRGAKRLLDERRVFVNAQRVWIARHRLRQGDVVEVADPPPSAGPAVLLPILYEDDQVLVADKPPGVESVGPNGVEGRLRKQLGRRTLAAVHRLDKQTTGCLILAADADIKRMMIPQFQAREVQKRYRAIVVGRMATGSRTLTMPLDGKSAVTRLRVLQSTAEAAYLAVRIETGRTHQIRRHLAAIRHPVIGDPEYVTGPLRAQFLRQVPRPMLHAVSVDFRHPVTAAVVRVRAEPPPDFLSWLQRLGLR